ncbi:MAG: hypothetical protein ACRDV3_13435, partial [Acidothermaceae bacterium]
MFSVTGCLLAVWMVFGLKLAAAAALVGLVGVIAARRASARRRAQALRRGVVELAHAIAGELRSGRPASVAFGVGIESAGESLRMLMAPVAELTRRGDLIDVCDA